MNTVKRESVMAFNRTCMLFEIYEKIVALEGENTPKAKEAHKAATSAALAVFDADIAYAKAGWKME